MDFHDKEKSAALIEVEKRLKTINQLIQNSAYLQAYLLIIEALDGLQQGKSLSSWQGISEPAQVRYLYQQLSDAIYQLFGNELFEMDKESYLRGLLIRERFHQCFCIAASPLLGKLLDHIIGHSARQQQGNISFTNFSDLYKFLLLASLSHPPSIDLLIRMISTNPAGVYYVVLSCVGDSWELGNEAQNTKKQLLAHFPKICKVTSSIQSLLLIQKCMAKTAYMDSSQAGPVKETCHLLLQNYKHSKGLEKYAQWKYYPLQTQPVKPKLILLCECCWPGHAVYRCFNELLMPLKDIFEVIAITAAKDHKQGPWEFCDQVIEISEDLYSLHLVIDKIRQLNADIALYTSVGMRIWAVLLSQIRLAPIQMMLPGHPDAQSPLPTGIDFLLTGKQTFDGQQPKNLIFDSPGSLYDLSLIESPQSPQRKEREVIHIGVCANVFKMTYPLLSFLSQIETESQCRLHFELFLNTLGMEYVVTKTQILQQLKEVTVHPSYQKNEYLSKLSNCDLLIGTFPFGGENTIVDALSQNVPVLVVRGDQMRSKLDERVLKSIHGIPEIAINDSVEMLKESCLTFLQDQSVRDNYHQFLQELDLISLFKNENDQYKNALRECLESYMENLT